MIKRVETSKGKFLFIELPAKEEDFWEDNFEWEIIGTTSYIKNYQAIKVIEFNEDNKCKNYLQDDFSLNVPLISLQSLILALNLTHPIAIIKIIS